MNKFILIAVLLLAGCTGKAEMSTRMSEDFTVDTLFTKDGCTVYRFEDDGYHRYFTNCSGSTMTKQSCGKNCTRPVEVSGNAGYREQQ